MSRHSLIKSQQHFIKSNLPMEYLHSRALEAKVLIEFKQFKEAKEILFGCIDKMKVYKKYKAIFGYYNFLSDLFAEQNDIKMVAYCNQKSAEFALLSKNLNTIALSKNNLAIAEFYKGNIENSISFFKEALGTRLKLKKQKLVSESYYNLGTVYASNDQIKQAIEYFQKSLEISVNNELMKETSDAYQALAEIYESSGDYKMAFEMNKQYLEIKEQLYLLSIKDSENLNVLMINFEKENIDKGHDKSSLQWQNKITLLYFLCGILLAGYAIILFLFSQRRFRNRMSLN